MRPVKLLLALACCVPALPAADAAAIATRQTQDITFSSLIEQPKSWQAAPIRFRAVWIGVTDLYDPMRSHFRSERYTNFAVWDVRAPLWDPVARAKPLPTLFMSKDAPGVDKLPKLGKYQIVDIEGTVFDIVDGTPRLEVTAVNPAPRQGAFTEPVLNRLQQATAMASQGAADLAEQDFAVAMASNLPGSARIAVGDLRARNLMGAGRWAEAITVLREVIPLADADGGLAVTAKAGLHASLARSLSESADADLAKHTEAVAEAEKAVALDPALSEAYAVIGVSLAGLGRFDEARLQCDRAVRLRPQDSAVRLALGRILDRQGRSDEAIDTLKRAIDLTPKDARAHRAIAAAYLSRGRKGTTTDLPIALRECEITLRLQQQDVEAIWLAGQVMEAAAAASTELPLQGGKAVPTSDQARERYQAALAIDPHFAPARASLQTLLDADAKAKADAEAKAKAEADAKAKADAAAAADAKAKADAEAAKAQADAKAKADADAKAKADADAKAKADADAKAKADADAKAKADAAAAADAKAKADAEAAKTQADAKAKADADAKAKADADAKAKADADAKAKTKADADAKAKADADAKAKAKADADAKADAKAKEQARIDAAEAKAKADFDALMKAKADAEAEAKAKEQARIDAAEAKAKADFDASAKADADAKAKSDADAKAKAKAKSDADAKEKERLQAIEKAKAETPVPVPAPVPNP